MESTVQNLKEFIWDILGYLIPGALAYILLIVIFTIKFPYFNTSIVFLVCSYIMGYVVYGINIYFYEISTSTSFKVNIEEKIREREEFTISLKKLNQELTTNFNNETKFRTLRSLVMSYIPESDTKIYNFTFRSELSNSCATVCYIFGIIGLINSFCQFIIKDKLLYFENYTYEYIIFYFLLIISTFFLKNARNKFYAMSMSVPFSIYAVKK